MIIPSVVIINKAKGSKAGGRRQKFFYWYAVVLAVQSFLSFTATGIICSTEKHLHYKKNTPWTNNRTQFIEFKN
jgi:hypothetical protein